jgi:hypothetical protein
MDNTDAVWVEPKLENLLESSDFTIKGSKYTIYFEPEIKASDIAFGYSKEGEEHISLFQITVDTWDKNTSRALLNRINFKDEQTLKEVVGLGEKIKKSYNPEELNSIKSKWREYIITYQADDIKILDQSLHNQYEKKLKERIC